MKLKISRKDKDGSDIHLGKFAVITDPVTDAMEALAADTVQIDELGYCRDRGILQIQVVLGGHDSKENFHMHPKFAGALISIHRDSGDQNGAKIWKDYDLDNIEGLDWKFLKQFLIDTNAIPVVARNQWNVPDCSAEIK